MYTPLYRSIPLLYYRLLCARVRYNFVLAGGWYSKLLCIDSGNIIINTNFEQIDNRAACMLYHSVAPSPPLPRVYEVFAPHGLSTIL